MRLWLKFVCGLVLAASPAKASNLIISDNNTVSFGTYLEDRSKLPTWQEPETGLVERPLAEVLAARLGIIQGHVELFDYRLENPSLRVTDMRAVVDGGGVKLKFTW